MIGKRIIQLHEVDSTNNYAAKLVSAGQLEHGTVILAEFQTAGKGQRGKNWLSNGAKQFIGTYYLKTDFLSVEHLCFFNMSVAIAIADTIKSYVSSEVKIKWPNDIFVEDQKIAGVLIETNWKNNGIVGAIVGIGVNFNPISDIPHATSIAEHAGVAPDLFEFVDSLSNQIAANYAMLKATSFDEIKQKYLTYLWKKDQLIHAVKQIDQSEIQGSIRGIDFIGNLLFEYDGIVEVFHNHEINFEQNYRQKSLI